MSEVWLPEGLPHHGYPDSLLRCSECVRKWNSTPRDETAAQKAAVRFPLEHLKSHLAGIHRQGALSSANSLLESYCMCLQELKCTNIQRKWTDNPELDALDRETGYLALGRWLDFTKLPPGSLPGVVSNSVPQTPPVHNQEVSTQAPRVPWKCVQPSLAEQAAARKSTSGTALNGFHQPSTMAQQAVAPTSVAPGRTWASVQGSPAHTMNGAPPARTQRRKAAVAPTQGSSPAIQQTSMPSSQMYAPVAASSLPSPSADTPFQQRLRQLNQAAAPSPAVAPSINSSPTVPSHIPQESPIVGHYDLVPNPAAVVSERTFACKVCTQAMPGVNFPQMIRADLEKHGREVHRLRDEEISSLFPHAGYKCQLCISQFSPAVVSGLPLMDQEDLENHGLQFHRLTQAELTQYTALSVRAVFSASGVGVASANNILNHSTAITLSPELASYAFSTASTATKPAQAAIQPPVVQGIPITPQNSAALFEAIVAPKGAHAPKPKPAAKSKPAPKPRGRKPKTALAETAADDTEVKAPVKRKRTKKPSKGYTCHLCTADNRWKKQTPMDFNGLMEHGLQHHAIPQSQIETFFTAAAGALISVHQNNVNKGTVQSMLTDPDTAQVISGVISNTPSTAPQGVPAAVTPQTAQGSFNVASPQAPNSPLSSLQNQTTQHGSTQNRIGNSIANNGSSQNAISLRPSQYSPSQNGVGLGLLSGGTIRCASMGSLTLPTSNGQTIPPTMDNTVFQSGAAPAATPVLYKSPYQTPLAVAAIPTRVEATAEANEHDTQWLNDIFGDEFLADDVSDQSTSPDSSSNESQESVTESKATPDSEAARLVDKESTSALGAEFEAEFEAAWNAQHGAEGTSDKHVDDITSAVRNGAPAPSTQVAQVTEQSAVGKDMEMSYDFSSESRAEPRFDNDISDKQLLDELTKFLRQPEKDSSQAKYAAASSEFTAESSSSQMPKENKSPLDHFGKLWLRGLDPAFLPPQESIQELGLEDLPNNCKDFACLYAYDDDGELGVMASDGVADAKWLNMQEWHEFKEAHLKDYVLLPDHELNMAGNYGQSVDEFVHYDFLGLGTMNMGMKHGRDDDEDIWADNLVDKRARNFY